MRYFHSSQCPLALFCFQEENCQQVDHSYTYTSDQADLTDLAHLIAANLHSPYGLGVNVNRIYNCISSIHSEFARAGFNSDAMPMNFYVNYRLLLAAALASSWFTERQRDRIVGYWSAVF